ncbi:FliM/FliN family flagellar motor switch protein [Deltaproteobacteria bacterium TL4]
MTESSKKKEEKDIPKVHRNAFGEPPVPFDLSKADQISRGCMPGLETVCERFSRLFQRTLSAAVHKIIKININTIELTKFSQFHESCSSPVALNVFGLHPLRGNALMMLEPQLVFTLVDLLCGGTGKRPFAPGTRTFTEVETKLIHRVVLAGLKDFQDAWRPLFPLQTSFVRTEFAAHLTDIIPNSEIAIRMVLDLNVGVTLPLTFYLPYSLLEPIHGLLYDGYQSREDERDQLWLNRFKRNLNITPLEIKAEVKAQPLTVRNLLHLKKGDLLMTALKTDQPVDIVVNGTKKFTGRLTRDKGRQTIWIEETLGIPVETELHELKQQVQSLTSDPSRSL